MREMRPMRRKDRAMEEAAARELLAKAEYGVLCTVGEDGLPYGVPVNHVVVGDALYFHCAKAGQKIDNMNHQPEVSFCVVGDAQPVFLGDFTTRFESAMAFGPVAEVTDDAEKIEALRALCEKVLPEHMQHFAESIEGALPATGVWRMAIENCTGKKRA